ncbi:MAG: amidohydrolase family protein [Actinobacteria bacterium]|nr:amidohydrolase family protein [Actinomycetota bacterium]MBU4240027.1 amidohydrolase family protein [Actinomycetota bacterium]MBU4386517.1 amidohydrolase family protein [Actinomycetota bacterium]MBU4490059.1 amidohydrolase family protein [Actinomycetota bacterium]MCG2794273.1 amidohydrolase family protein [Actinomycetes bacterium]
MIIDAHTHIFPPDVIERREMFAKRDSSFDFIYSNPKARMVTHQGLIEKMDSAGVDRAIVCGFPWRSLDMCRNHNTYMMEAVAAHPDRLIGLAMTNPVAGKASDIELDRCFEGGLSGVGEISADAQGFRLDDTGTTGRIAAAVEEAGLFMLLHVNEDVGHFYPGKTATTPAPVYRFLEKFPDTVAILAHWGGGLFFYELMPEVAKVTSSVYYDTAASPFLYRPAIYKAAVDIVGPGRILFGTDFPLLKMQRHLDEVEAAGLADDAKAAILGRNALALLGHRFEG